MSQKRKDVLWLVAAAMTLVCSACHSYHNRFTPARDQPRAVERADGLVTAAEHALDNARRQADNIVD